MKAYTDLEQSRTLAEILSTESADMCWCNNSIRGINYTDEFSANLCTVKEMKDTFDTALNGWDKYWELIPCWSLSALLSIVPNICLNNFTDGTWNAMVEYNGKMIWANSDNPVDACVEMILKLHELKLI